MHNRVDVKDVRGKQGRVWSAKKMACELQANIDEAYPFMKHVLLLLILCCLIVGGRAQQLSSSILAAQKHAIRISPYLDAYGFHIPVLQKRFRLTGFPKTIRGLLSGRAHLADTLWLVENFPDECRRCPAFATYILYQDTLYTLRESTTEFIAVPFKKRAADYIILEVIDSVRSKRNWMGNPLTFGSNSCWDGEHTLVTVVYPNLRIEAMYVRCWRPPF